MSKRTHSVRKEKSPRWSISLFKTPDLTITDRAIKVGAVNIEACWVGVQSWDSISRTSSTFSRRLGSTPIDNLVVGRTSWLKVAINQVGVFRMHPVSAFSRKSRRKLTALWSARMPTRPAKRRTWRNLRRICTLRRWMSQFHLRHLAAGAPPRNKNKISIAARNRATQAGLVSPRRWSILTHLRALKTL